MDRRLLRSLPFLRPSQIPQRGVRVAAEVTLLSRGGRWAVARASLPRAVRALARPSPRSMLWEGRDEEAREVLAGCVQDRFTFLGEERTFDAGVRWDEPSVPRLWRFHLNYFSIAWALAKCGAEGGRQLARLIDQWDLTQPPRRDDAWHPYVVAERVLNLLGTRGAWLPHASNPTARLGSLFGQAWYMRHALEQDIGGNHVVRDAAALVVAGDAFSDPGLTRAGVRLASSALRRQILRDGMHEERSPSYHLEVMTDLAEIRGVLTEDHTLARRLDDVLPRMSRAARTLVHGDGTFPHFNDTSRWPVDPINYLDGLGYSDTNQGDLSDAGYFVLRGGDDRMLVDAGAPAPRDLPPHAHCDALSFELAVRGVPLIVNSGTGDYEAGPWRDYWRSTRANNTVEIDHEDQSEVWSSFRMARRATISDVIVRRDEEGSALAASHDGYQRLPNPVRHRRTIVERGGVWFVLDELAGRGHIAIRSFLHRHVAAAISMGDGVARVTREGATLHVAALGSLPMVEAFATADPVANWFADSLGERWPSSALVLMGEVRLPAVVGWVLSSVGPVRDGQIALGSGGVQSVTVTLGDSTLEMDRAAWKSVNP